MPTPRPNVLVTGGTGTVGRQAMHSLLKANDVAVRALVRDVAKAAWIAEAGGDIISGSFEDDSAISRALADVDTLALITPAGPRAFEQAGKVVALAKQAGVRKVVRLSAIKADEDGPTDNTRQHAMTERDIRESGMTYVFLRPNYYMQNFLGSLRAVLQEGKLYAGMGEAKIAVIDARDVGDAVAAAVRSNAFDGEALELSGPRSITHHTIAEAIGAALGRHVEYVAVPSEAVGEFVRKLGRDDWAAQVVADYARAYSRGFGDLVTNAVRSLTAHEPRDISTFAREILAPAAERWN
jgi:uncharacterized protein YbjT (DUF2867 family)